MSPAALLMLLAVPTGALSGGRIERYEIEAEMMPAGGKLRATAAVTVVATDSSLERIDVLLNRGLAVRSLTCERGIRSFRFDRSQAGVYRYAPTASPLSVELDEPIKAGESTVVRLRYEGTVDPDPWGTNVLASDWIELGQYTAWFPYDPDSTRFTSEVRLRVPEEYVVTGSGSVVRSGGGWVLTQEWPSNDVVVVASRDLRVRRVAGEGLGVQLWHTGLSDEQADRISGDVRRVVEEFQGWFGPVASDDLTVVFARRNGGGGYSRPGFLSLIHNPESGERRGLVRFLAHEVAHFWWNRGSTTTWEDWLNESFAEYSALLLVRSWYGSERFEELLERYGAAAENAPVIWGLDRDDEAAYTALYRKGPLLLHGLEATLGSAKLLDFLATLVEREVSSTDELLATLEELASRGVREAFERSLKR